jgi:hypothetical protein
VLAFEGDRSEFSMKNAMLSELMLTLTGEPMPYATLMYVWCNACAKETVLVNPRTDRIREIVLETGPDHIGQWLNYQRDIQADYLKAFGQTPGALVGIGLMTDTYPHPACQRSRVCANHSISPGTDGFSP